MACPLYVRDISMSLATVTLWFLYVSLPSPSFLPSRISLTPLPRATSSSPSQCPHSDLMPGPHKARLGWFAAWNVFGFVMALLFVPETRALSLEEIDQVFGVPTRTHAAYQVQSAVRWVCQCVLRQRVGCRLRVCRESPPLLRLLS